MEKKHIILSIITICLFAFLVSYAAYAYISPSINVNAVNIETSTGGQVYFSATGGKENESSIEYSNISDGTRRKVNEITDTFNIVLEAEGNKLICCSYNIVFLPSSSYSRTTGTTDLEFTYEINAVDNFNTLNNDVDRIIRSETNFPNFTESSGNINLASYNVCNQNNVTGGYDEDVVQDVTITVRFYNLNANQGSLKGQSISGEFFVDGNSVQCTRTRTY